MNYRSFLIKYAEIGVKGKNRYLFEDALVKQIHHRLKRLEGGFTVTKEAGRIYAEASEAFDFDEVVNALQHVFGIVGICPMKTKTLPLRWWPAGATSSIRWCLTRSTGTWAR